MGLSPRVKAAAAGEKYPYVLFAAPPSGSEDYAGEVRWGGGVSAGGCITHVDGQASSCRCSRSMLAVPAAICCSLHGRLAHRPWCSGQDFHLGSCLSPPTQKSLLTCCHLPYVTSP
jgi:hypothetical protein